MPGANDNPLLVDAGDGVVTLTLHRPRALNALDRELAAILMAALQTAERDAAIRVVVITGAGKAFCCSCQPLD